jgi:hypothetical protein
MPKQIALRRNRIWRYPALGVIGLQPPRVAMDAVAVLRLAGRTWPMRLLFRQRTGAVTSWAWAAAKSR